METFDLIADIYGIVIIVVIGFVLIYLTKKYKVKGTKGAMLALHSFLLLMLGQVTKLSFINEAFGEETERMLDIICEFLSYFISLPMLAFGIYLMMSNAYRRNQSFREIEERYSTLFQNSKTAMLIINAEDNMIVDANPSACEFYGYEKEKLVKMSMFQINVMSQEELEPIAKQALRGEISNIQFRHKLANGEIRDVEVFPCVIRLKGKNLVFEIIHDITQRKLMEKALQKSQQRFKQLTEISTEGICIFDYDRKIIDVNTALCRIIDYSPGELIGKSIFDYISPKSHENLKRRLDTEVGLSAFEYIVIRRDGREIIIEGTSDTIIYNNNECVVSVLKDVTERKEMEKELRESKEKLYNVLSNADAMICQLDENGTVLLLEGTATSKINNEPEQYVGANIAEILRNRKNIDPYLEEGLAGRKVNFEIEIDNYIFDVNFSPLLSNEGTPKGGIAVATDITSRKQFEAELKVLKERLMEAQGIAHIGNWEYNIKNDKGFWSEELLRIFGYEPAEETPEDTTFLNQVHPEDFNFVKNAIDGLSLGQEFCIEYRILTKNGQWKWVHDKSQVEFDESGKPLRLYGTVQDITDRKDVEAKVLESEEKYKTLANCAPVGIVSFDRNGTINFVNPAALDLLGSPSAEATSNINLFTFEPLQKYGLSQEFKKTIETGNFVSAEKLYVSIWGKRVYSRIQVAPIKDEKGEVTGALAIMEDFSLRKEMELEIQKAKENAELSNKAKSEFLANMSHEIRTPLNGIIGMVDLTLLSNLDGEQRGYLEMVKVSSKSLLRIINDILDYSKIEAGKIEIENKEFSIGKMVKEISDFFNIEALRKELKIETAIAPDVPDKVIGDSVRLRQVLSNLVGNALKFTHKGNVSLSIEKVYSDNEKTRLQFTITDTGIGISKGNMDKLFASFTQADSSTTRHYGGTGLGLAISKRLVELMDGEIWAESEEGKGSKFSLTVVFRNEEAIKSIQQDSSKNYIIHDQKVKEIKEKEAAILIAEDDEVAKIVIREFLKDKNIETVFVKDGIEAINNIKEKHFDLVLMDVQMPNMDGYQATGIIRYMQDNTNSVTPIIAVTESASERDKKRCLESGMDDYITRPIDIDVLFEKIQIWLGKSHISG